MTNCCYECGAEVPMEEITAYQEALSASGKGEPFPTPAQSPKTV
jgi:hypothetical protein